jgi:hypothetical protein
MSYTYHRACTDMTSHFMIFVVPASMNQLPEKLRVEKPAESGGDTTTKADELDLLDARNYYVSEREFRSSLDQKRLQPTLYAPMRSKRMEGGETLSAHSYD